MIQKIKDINPYHHVDSVEPGLFQLFRTYIIFFDVIILFHFFAVVIENQVLTHFAYYPGLAALILLNFFLLNRRAQKKHGPNLLAVCISLYILISASFLWGELTVWIPTEMFDWLQFYFRFGFTTLFIPFIIAAWQFGLRGTFGYLGLAALMEIGVFLFILDDKMLFYSIGFIIFRSVNYFIIGLIISRLMLAQRKQRYELKMANQQLTHYATTLEQLSVSRERNRLARELHDTLAHTLSGVSVQLEAVRALWDPKPQEAKSMLSQALSDTRSGLTDTRRALKDLRSEPLEDLGLELALEYLCVAFNNRTSLEVELALPDDLNPQILSAAVQNCLYRTLQEALTNIDRHAGANHVKINLTHNGSETLMLHISDDGIGFDPDSHPEEGHFGLRGMRERAELIGGSCVVESTPGQGTTITLQLKEESV